jgi:small redox-active disulfide protein 2
MNIKILGIGCAKCLTLERKVKEILQQLSIDAEVQKVSDLKDIMRYRVMMTPALVTNEKVVSYGNIPKDSQIIQWIKEEK